MRLGLNSFNRRVLGTDDWSGYVTVMYTVGRFET